MGKKKKTQLCSEIYEKDFQLYHLLQLSPLEIGHQQHK